MDLLLLPFPGLELKTLYARTDRYVQGALHLDSAKDQKPNVASLTVWSEVFVSGTITDLHMVQIRVRQGS